MKRVPWLIMWMVFGGLLAAMTQPTIRPAYDGLRMLVAIAIGSALGLFLGNLLVDSTPPRRPGTD